MRKYMLAAYIGIISVPVDAAIIGPGDFGGNEFIQTYEDVGLSPGSVHLPELIAGDLYTIASGSSSTIRYDDRNCISGFCLNYGGGSSGYFITLGNTEAHRVGLYILGSSLQTHRFTYYDSDGAVLGTDDVGITVSPGVRFYGFESLGTPISKVRFNLQGSIGSFNSWDNLTTETVVPIPAAVWLFGSGLIGLIGVARRRASA